MSANAQYILLLVVAVALTFVVGQLLIRAGEPFLFEVFQDRKVTRSVNLLLSVLFYLITLGVLAIMSVLDIANLQDQPLQNFVVRLGIVLLGVGIGLALGWTTQIGKDFVTYCQDSITETKKVVWPSRKETFQTTGIVVLFVLIMAVFLWVVDASLVYLVRILVGREA